MSATFDNSFFGLWQGTVDNNASSVINAIADDVLLLVGDVVGLDKFPILDTTDLLLPPVEVIISSPSEITVYGVVVSGDADGIYGKGQEPKFETPNEFGTLAGLRGDTLRVCTQGRCLARVFNEGAQMNVNDPLSGAGFASKSISGVFVLATSGLEVQARLLQPVPAGSVPSPTTRIVAVDVQREGILP